MTTQIANPIYDVVFKGIMENEPAAKVLLSALLGKKIIHLEPGRNEFTNDKVREFSIYRIDFSAVVEDEKGLKERITIEIQKTWTSYEIGRFRNYIAKQYSAAENMITVSHGKNEKKISRPMVTIYILGHLLPQVRETVVYVKRSYLNHLCEVINTKDDFIESLTHDCIIVQVPLLSGKVGTHVERVLSVFDQHLISPDGSNHRLDYDTEKLDPTFRDEIAPLVRCLNSMASNKDVQEVMKEEDYYLSEMEFNNQILEGKNKVIEKQQETILEKDNLLAQKDQDLAQKEEDLAKLKQQLEEAFALLNKKL